MHWKTHVTHIISRFLKRTWKTTICTNMLPQTRKTYFVLVFSLVHKLLLEHCCLCFHQICSIVTNYSYYIILWQAAAFSRDYKPVFSKPFNCVLHTSNACNIWIKSSVPSAIYKISQIHFFLNRLPEICHHDLSSVDNMTGKWSSQWWLGKRTGIKGLYSIKRSSQEFLWKGV